MVVITGLLVFVATVTWGYFALAAGLHGNDPVQLERCGGSLPYTFLNIVAALGFFTGASSIWSSLSYANSGKHGRWFLAALLITLVLLALWTQAGGFAAAACAFD
jgi:hypothetical protein